VSFHGGMKRDVGDAGVVLIAAAFTLRHQLNAHCRSEYLALRDCGHLAIWEYLSWARSNVTPLGHPRLPFLEAMRTSKATSLMT
jgi:hypothetical protein